MKLHQYVKKLFDAQDPYVRHEKKLAKENQRKARGPLEAPEHPSLRHRFKHHFHSVFGYIHWRGHRPRGQKGAGGKLLPLNQTDIRTHE